MQDMKQRKSIWPALIVAVLVVVAVIIILTTVVNPVTVVIAKEPIAQGVVLTADMLDLKTIPAGGKPSGSFSKISDVVGQQLAVARTTGDVILQDCLGNAATAGIPGELQPGHVAVAIHVNQATGLAGLLRPGQNVTLFGTIGPSVLPQEQSVSGALPQTGMESLPTLGAGTPTPTVTPQPTATQLKSTLGRIAITGVRVLMIPYSFRYEEVNTGGANNANELLFNSARTSSSAQQSSVIVLDVPVEPVNLAGMMVSPAALITMLDQYGTIAIWLEPAAGLVLKDTLTLNLADFYTKLNDASPDAIATPKP